MKKLRIKMIQIVVLSVIAVFALCIVGVFAYSYTSCTYDADKITQMIEDNNGMMPKYSEGFKYERRFEDNIFGSFEFDEEAEFTTRYFVVYMDDQGNERRAAMDKIAAVEPDEAQSMSQEALAKGDPKGWVDGYRYRIGGDYTNQYVIFVDCRTSLTGVWGFTYLVTAVAILLTILIFVVFFFASKRAIKPFEENSRRQRQFITDAGHELKTPLAVISANAEVLDYKSPDTKEWTSKIKTEVKNLNRLIAQLLFLSKAEEVDNEIDIDDVDFSAIVKEKIVEYTDLFEGKGIHLNTEGVADNIKTPANFDGINRLVSILFDNCGKYAADNGDVIIILRKSPRHIHFSIANTDSNDGPIDTDRLFDRFYRSDSSRNSSTGGHGIGLSIAKRICLQHKGDITCTQKAGFVKFEAQIPTNLKPTKNKAST